MKVSPIQPAPISVVRRQFSKSNSHFDEHAVVFTTVGKRLLERLDLLAAMPSTVLDLGCRSGYQLQALAQRYPSATIIGADPAPGTSGNEPVGYSNGLVLRGLGRGIRQLLGWRGSGGFGLHRVACDPHTLPFADDSFDLVISNLFLPWCEQPFEVFKEVSRILSPDGAFLFTSAGPDTLTEYRTIWSGIDTYPHIFGLIDMHDLGDSMLAAGFAAPVLDRENLHVDYPDFSALESELRLLGAANVAAGRRRGLMASDVGARLRDSVGAAERFSVTFELINGHGWKGELVPQGQNSSEGFAMPVDKLRKTLKKSSYNR
ncbi:MAG: methyltransferase domain-containing protein [Granulosicoccus sp.]